MLRRLTSRTSPWLVTFWPVGFCFLRVTKILDCTPTVKLYYCLVCTIVTSCNFNLLIFIDTPYLFCLLKNGTFNVYSLPGMNKMNVKWVTNTSVNAIIITVYWLCRGAIPDVKSSLYSSTGSFSVLQLSPGVNLKLITLQHLVTGTCPAWNLVLTWSKNLSL